MACIDGLIKVCKEMMTTRGTTSFSSIPLKHQRACSTQTEGSAFMEPGHVATKAAGMSSAASAMLEAHGTLPPPTRQPSQEPLSSSKGFLRKDEELLQTELMELLYRPLVQLAALPQRDVKEPHLAGKLDTFSCQGQANTTGKPETFSCRGHSKTKKRKRHS